MKKLFGFLSILVFSTSAFAFQKGGEWQGGGFWRSKDGDKGKWTSTLTLAKGKDGYDWKETTVVHMPNGKTQTMQEEWTAKSTGNGFFDLTKNGNAHGTAYCGYKQCHLQGTEFEETLTFHGSKIYRIGSHSDKNHTVMWQGAMKPAKKAEKTGCTDCAGCTDCKCTDCKDCADCKGCTDCKGDKGCAADQGCTDCQCGGDSKACAEGKGCTDCEACKPE